MDSQIVQKYEKYLELVISQNGSDLHMSAGNYPAIRVDSNLMQLDKESILSAKEMEALVDYLLNEERKAKLKKDKQIDFSLEGKGGVRFRANIFYQKGLLSFCARLIPEKIKNLKELSLPENLYDFTKKRQGLFLITGPNGHGKTTALAALIDYINKNKRKHIITIEDPIEYVFKSNKSIVEQREIYQDANDFHGALESCFREDVDVILVGEMRDLETISTAITAAETGHLIFATLHTNDAFQTIDRIIDIFPANQQNQIRYQLANVLGGILSLRLLSKVGGGRIPAYEILIKNNAVENLIRQNQTHQIPMVIDTSLDDGMLSINRSLAKLVKKELVRLEEAKSFATDQNSFKLLLEE